MEPVGTEIVLGEDEEPSFEVDDEIDRVIREINAWGYLCRGGKVTYTGYEVPVSGLRAFTESAEALAEQYGDGAREWTYEREITHVDGTTEMRRSTVTGPEFRQAMLSLAATAGEAARRGTAMILNMDD